MKATKLYSRVFPPKRFPYETFLPMLPLVSVYSMFFRLLQHFSSPFILFDSSRHLSKRGGDNHKLERQSRDFYEITTIFFVRFPFGEQKLLNESLFIISMEISRIFWLGLILRQSRLIGMDKNIHIQFHIMINDCTHCWAHWILLMFKLCKQVIPCICIFKNKRLSAFFFDKSLFHNHVVQEKFPASEMYKFSDLTKFNHG